MHTIDYLNHRKDQWEGGPLQLWCIKEACFKALGTKLNQGASLKQIFIKKNNFYFQKKTKLYSGQFRLRKFSSPSELYVATAIRIDETLRTRS